MNYFFDDEDQNEQREKECLEIATKYPWLAEEIAAVSEASYRRGFQQGNISGQTDFDVANWRYQPFGDMDRYKTATTPPNHTLPSMPAIKRLDIEAANASAEIGEIVYLSLAKK